MMTQEKQILFNAAMVRSVLSDDKIHTRRPVKSPLKDRDIVFLPDQEIDADSKRWWGENPNMDNPHNWGLVNMLDTDPLQIVDMVCPYGSVGDELWVRENVRAIEVLGGGDFVEYIADGEIQQIWNTEESAENWIKLYNYSNGRGKTVPSIHMPRWASRIQLRITDIHIERLHQISKKDAIKEGVTQRGNLFCMDWSPVGQPTGYKNPDGSPHLATEHYIASDHPVGAFAAYWEKMSGKDSWEENPFVWVIAFERIKP